MNLESSNSFIFTIDDLIYESYKSLTGKDKVNRKSKKFINYKESKLDKQSNFVHKFGDNVSASYVDRICNSKYNGKKNRILFISLTGKINYNDIVATIVDKKVLNVKEKLRYVIFMFGVLPELRSKGIGRKSLGIYHNFISNKKKKTEVILHSLESSIGFYKKIGYNEIEINYFLLKYEGYSIDKKDQFVLFKIVLPKLKKSLNELHTNQSDLGISGIEKSSVVVEEVLADVLANVLLVRRKLETGEYGAEVPSNTGDTFIDKVRTISVSGDRGLADDPNLSALGAGGGI